MFKTQEKSLGKRKLKKHAQNQTFPKSFSQTIRKTKQPHGEKELDRPVKNNVLPNRGKSILQRPNGFVHVVLSDRGKSIFQRLNRFVPNGDWSNLQVYSNKAIWRTATRKWDLGEPRKPNNDYTRGAKTQRDTPNDDDEYITRGQPWNDHGRTISNNRKDHEHIRERRRHPIVSKETPTGARCTVHCGGDEKRSKPPTTRNGIGRPSKTHMGLIGTISGIDFTFAKTVSWSMNESWYRRNFGKQCSTASIWPIQDRQPCWIYANTPGSLTFIEPFYTWRKTAHTVQNKVKI